VSVRDRVCCPVGSLNRPPHASLNWDEAQRVAKYTDTPGEGVADADCGGVAVSDADGADVADWVSKLGLAGTDVVARIAAGEPLQPVLTTATARAPLTARRRQSTAKVQR